MRSNKKAIRINFFMNFSIYNTITFVNFAIFYLIIRELFLKLKLKLKFK